MPLSVNDTSHLLLAGSIESLTGAHDASDRGVCFTSNLKIHRLFNRGPLVFDEMDLLVLRIERGRFASATWIDEQPQDAAGRNKHSSEEKCALPPISHREVWSEGRGHRAADLAAHIHHS
jgi:hypothetical protein